MNPHQTAKVVADVGAVKMVAGEPSLINYLDALNGWQLVSETDAVTGRPAAASFKHVSPAGVAVAGDLDETAQLTWAVTTGVDELTAAYIRARDADPKSSFGDVVAVSRPVTLSLAAFLTGTITDAIIAPGYEAGTVERLSSKRGGRFLMLEVDPAVDIPVRERRVVYGMTFEQDRDSASIGADMLVGAGDLSAGEKEDVLVALAGLRYTQSNSVVITKAGMALGIGAGQQNRVDCVRLAVAKARLWWLRRHPYVRELATVTGMKRQDRLNWQLRFAERAMTRMQLAEFVQLFGAAAGGLFADDSWRHAWAAQLTELTMASDGFLPFRDNLDYAAEGGVTTVVEPAASSIRTPEVREAATELGITHLTTTQRMFHH